jgi:Tol biopolymer transport system component
MFVLDAFDLSPDGALVAFATEEQATAGTQLANLAILELDSGEVTRFPEPAVGRFPTFSPGGTEILHESHLDDGTKTIDVMDLAGTHLRRLAISTAGNAGPRWSPDGGHVAFCDTTAEGAFALRVVPAQGGELRTVPETGDELRPFFEWSPDSTMLAYMDPELVVLDLETWTAEDIVTPTGTGRLTWSPTSDQLLVDIWLGDEAPQDMELAIVDLDTGHARTVSQGWTLSFADWE